MCVIKSRTPVGVGERGQLSWPDAVVAVATILPLLVVVLALLPLLVALMFSQQLRQFALEVLPELRSWAGATRFAVEQTGRRPDAQDSNPGLGTSPDTNR
jgi:hypothetical protein